jgi:hypothetical protein
LQQGEKPHQMVERVLSGMPEDLRLPFLAHAEQRAKQTGDLEILRALKEYRRLHLPPTSTKPLPID